VTFPRQVRSLLSGLVALGLAFSLPGGCGYHPARATLPGGHTSVRVIQPNPGAVGEPDLARMFAAELCRELARAGIQASTAGEASTALTTRLIGLQGLSPVLAPGPVVAARRLQLRLEVALRTRGGQTLWRSGLLEAEQLWTLSPGDALASEAAREDALRRLASRGARQAVELLLLGP